MADQDLDLNKAPNYDGGGASSSGSDFSGGSSYFPSSPLSGAGPSGESGFVTKYKNVAESRDQLRIINATFRDFNNPPYITISGNFINVNQKAEVLDFLNVAEFFHPLQSFSEYQKQTFVITPRTTINLDPSSFDSTLGEVSMVIARAYYLPEAKDEDRILFWDYKGSERNPMGQFMVLSGAVKNGYLWNGWDLNPFPDQDSNLPANIGNGGLYFTNPTDLNVKLTIIIAN